MELIIHLSHKEAIKNDNVDNFFHLLLVIEILKCRFCFICAIFTNSNVKKYLFSAKTGGENSRGHNLPYDMEGRKEGRKAGMEGGKKRMRGRKKESLTT